MKNTILSLKDSKLIEEAILGYGRILSISDLMVIFKKQYSKSSAHNRINLLTKLGWFRRIKKGLYLIIDSISSRSQNDISQLVIANSLVNNSYVSLTLALNYYNFFDQLSKEIISITIKENKTYIFDNFTYKFSKIKKSMFFGFTKKMYNGRIIKIADAEKALIDYLYLDNSFNCASTVSEIIKEHYKDLNLDKLQDYAIKSSITIQKKIGFFLDQNKLDSTKLYQTIKNNRGVSHFTTESKLFNAKWRIYYDDRIIR